MILKNKIFKNLYQDSVSLMQISASINKLAGIEEASVVMGTPTNLEQLKDAQLNDGAIDAGPNDLIIAVKGTDEAVDEALKAVEEQLTKKSGASDQGEIAKQPLVSIEMALENKPEANCVLISVPGEYAAAEAVKALNLGLHVMLFSDNVSPEEELMIKKLAVEKGLLVMGPDCGTAIINGVPLAFANKVQRGKIGIIAASGTGLQEVSCRIDQLGEGVSQAIGTGGHDLSELIAGRTMRSALRQLAEDKETALIVLVSKPPAKDVAEAVLAQAKGIKKPVVIHFLGDDGHSNIDNLFYAHTLSDAAEQAVSLLKTNKSKPFSMDVDVAMQAQLEAAAQKLSKSRKYIRGIFAGGTFCFEGQLICAARGIHASSNTPVKGNQKLKDIWKSQEHTFIDMGDDDFTRGKPHPMIDPSQRNLRIHEEMLDPETAVVLLDLVLGYGASEDPSTELLEAIASAKAQLNTDCPPVLIAHVCGTDKDIQNRDAQINALKKAGVLVANSNAEAALWAAFVANAV